MSLKLIDRNRFAGMVMMTMKKEFTLIGQIMAKWVRDNQHVEYNDHAAGMHLLRTLRSTLANWPRHSGEFDPDDECSTEYIDACLAFMTTIHESRQVWPLMRNPQGRLEPLLPSKVADEVAKELDAAQMGDFVEAMTAITRAIAANSPYGDTRRAGLAGDGQSVAKHAVELGAFGNQPTVDLGCSGASSAMCVTRTRSGASTEELSASAPSSTCG